MNGNRFLPVIRPRSTESYRFPRVDFVKDGDLEMDHGILVNPFLETDKSGGFAAGDVACYRDVRADKLRRFEHWDNAKSQGQHAVRAMLGT